MKKKDLKSGMIAIDTLGNRYLVMMGTHAYGDCLLGIGNDYYLSVGSYNEDLMFDKDGKYDIVELRHISPKINYFGHSLPKVINEEFCVEEVLWKK